MQNGCKTGGITKILKFIYCIFDIHWVYYDYSNIISSHNKIRRIQNEQV